jgi:tetratricopeptide (TPR) repeat protein
MPKALEQVRHAAAILPKRLIYRWNVSLYASYGTDFATGESEARSLQQTAPESPLGFSALGFAQMGLGQVDQALGTYQKLETMGKENASDARSGLSDLAIYEGRYSDAVRILEQGAAEDLANKQMDRAARKFALLAYTHLLRGQKAPAIAAANKALEARTSYKTRFLAGMVFAANGETARARKLAAELGSELLSERQAYGRMIEGEIALAAGDPRAAIKSFMDANNLVDTWIGRFGLGRAYLAQKLFTEADSEFDQCIKRRGEALALFLDESPTYGYFPQVYYFQGAVREGLGAGFAESYRTYVSIRGKSAEDPLLANARKQAGQ